MCLYLSHIQIWYGVVWCWHSGLHELFMLGMSFCPGFGFVDLSIGLGLGDCFLPYLLICQGPSFSVLSSVS